jgi:hypothetical protein
MKTRSYKVLFMAGILGLVCTTSCKKQLDINQNPNVPAVANGTPSVVFPAAVFGTAAGVAGEFGIIGAIWGQYVTQSAFSNQYKTIDAYQIGTADYNRGYRNLFANGLKNYQFVLDKSKETENWNFYLMAATMKAYTAQVLVDLYDQIPYSEALQGTANLTPKFDDGYSIYQDLLKLLDTALAKPLNPGVLTPADKSADLVFKGDLDKWTRFANSMKMKLYLRMVNKKPQEAQAGIEKLYADGAKFLNTDAALTGFTNVKDKDNPMYEQNIRSLNTPDNLRASYTFTSFLIANNDPRAAYFFGTPNPTAVHQGDYTGTNPSYKTATVLVQRPDDPVVFMSAAESYFMQAESRERYFGGDGAKALYDQGVLAAFAETGNDGSAFIAPGGAYEYPFGSLEEKIQAISTQKWVACAYGVHYLEGFFEKNRTGYPKTSPVYSELDNNTVNPDYVPGEFVTSKNSVLGPGQLPKRLVFPLLETQANPNAPALVPITTPVWWAL